MNDGHRRAARSARLDIAMVALLATGCTLATSFDGLSGGQRRTPEAVDASADGMEHEIDAPETSDTIDAVVESSDESPDLDVSQESADATWETYDAPFETSDVQPSEVCVPDRCPATTCLNGVQDGTETAIDCGGSCPPCQNGRACVVASDCASRVCSGASQAPGDAAVPDGSRSDASTAEGGLPPDAEAGSYRTCRAPTCLDRVLNGEETDVDCGGPCPTCPSGAVCRSWADCQSKLCVTNRCAIPRCNDGVLNGNESAVDCGGTCPACPPGQRCSFSSDCSSGVCKGQICEPATCMDGVRNGVESDVDCGGGTCPTCSDGRRCITGADCTSAVCRGGTCRTD